MNPYADYQMAVENQRKLEEWAAAAAQPRVLARLTAIAERFLGARR